MTRPPRILALGRHRPSLGYLPSERRAAQVAAGALDELVRSHGPLARKAEVDAARVLSACLHAAHWTAAYQRLALRDDEPDPCDRCYDAAYYRAQAAEDR